eukprot:1839573-Amphidinium_carterae.2
MHRGQLLDSRQAWKALQLRKMQGQRGCPRGKPTRTTLVQTRLAEAATAQAEAATAAATTNSFSEAAPHILLAQLMA